jgi:hypothetical protein
VLHFLYAKVRERKTDAKSANHQRGERGTHPAGGRCSSRTRCGPGFRRVTTCSGPEELLSDPNRKEQKDRVMHFWRWGDCSMRPSNTRPNSREGCASAWGSPGRWPCGPRCCCWTSPSGRSTCSTPSSATVTRSVSKNWGVGACPGVVRCKAEGGLARGAYGETPGGTKHSRGDCGRT